MKPFSVLLKPKAVVITHDMNKSRVNLITHFGEMISESVDKPLESENL